MGGGGTVGGRASWQEERASGDAVGLERDFVDHILHREARRPAASSDGSSMR